MVKSCASWAIKGNAILDDLLVFIEITDKEKKALLAVKAQAEAVAPELAEAFYNRLSNLSNTMEFVEGKVEHLKKTLQKWFIELFSGDYGETYLQERLRIGEAHVRIGLPIRYPLAMIDIMLEFGWKATANSPEARSAFEKLLALDMAIFNHAYEDAQLRHLEKFVGNERLARRMLMEEAE